MGLRFSILGFAQERVVELRAMSGNKELRLDVTDLLLLNQIADFPNRKYVMKVIEGEKIYFWMAYSTIIEELPILNLKKQALRDRFDKLVALGLLEKTTHKTSNMTFFRLTDLYEHLKYDNVVYSIDGEDVVTDRGVYSDTQGVCSELHTISVNKYINKDIEKESNKEKDVCDNDMSMLSPAEHTIPYAPRNKNVSSEEILEYFEDLWLLYERKGSKAHSKKEFAKLTEEEVLLMAKHIPAYIQSRPERQYRQDFERYIKHKTFNSVVYSKQNEVLYDPEAHNTSATIEQTHEQPVSTDTYTINGTIYR